VFVLIELKFKTCIYHAKLLQVAVYVSLYMLSQLSVFFLGINLKKW